MSTVNSLVGLKFGLLIVLERSNDNWICQCVCGKTKVVDGKNLMRGATRSCGCLRKKKRGTYSRK